ncbi:large-conductance mechanosensitive channel protein MscL [Phaeodactylibacter sp.]|jgi:large conductance mechanosensitive channel|uniref:large-conductance mechanosensitive channel protein MscL n=1 Tax=Phaeodactylibacter sp. TaxID=1940289 RepID=UPI0025FD1C46|nr:large-conductance mechanosensitive channel protein MscL [Phaeodactylibacter sp.]MCI4650101.1 large-conductance mechanosensitive channel protein MscL [Phaeodactylibacter sp.]MCI5091754.1 large-conductance mechanosensitive channel protein MscL [Phaeodactylibacter sp.]
MLKEFKAFIMKGNVLELAVAVIIAGAFGAIVKSLTADVIMPPIGLALGGADFSSLAIVLQEGVSNDAGELVQEEVAIRYGIFIQRILDFVIIAFIVFMIIRSYNRLTEKKEAEEAPPAPKGPSQEELLAEIRDLLKK